MNEGLRKSVDLFAENEVTVQNNFIWNSQTNDFVCALEYSVDGLKVDVERMKQAGKIIESKTGILSEFRGHSFYIMATQMAMSDDMEAYFNYVKDVYDVIVEGKWFSDDNYIVAAMLIAQHTKGDVEKAKEIYKKATSIFKSMKKNHPWITDERDLGMAVLLAVSGLAEEDVVKEMEVCYSILKEANIGSLDAIQTLSQILSLQVGNAQEKCDKIISIHSALKEQNKKFGLSSELCILGVLAFVDENIQTMAKEIAEVDEYLKSKKGDFGILGVGDKQILMYSIILVMQQYCKEMNGTADAVAVIIATQIAIYMMIMNDLFFTNMMLFSAIR